MKKVKKATAEIKLTEVYNNGFLAGLGRALDLACKCDGDLDFLIWKLEKLVEQTSTEGEVR